MPFWHKLKLRDTCQEFESFSSNIIENEIFRVICFYISALRYLKKKTPYFIEVTDIELIAKSDVDNPNNIVTKSK